jgi:hypothetical protein
MKYLVLSMALWAAAVAAAQESQTEPVESQPALHGLAGGSWDSQYVWRGFDMSKGDSVVDVFANVNLFDTGFGISAVGYQGISEAFGSLQQWNGAVFYQNGLFAGEPYATNFRIGAVYYYYPKTNYGLTEDLVEGHVILAWPNLLPIKGLQPSYVFAYVRPGQTNPWAEYNNPNFDENATGMFHIAMLDYAFTVPAVLPGMDEQMVRLHSELVYNTGMSPFGTEVKSGFSDAVVGASTDFTFGANKNIVLTPSLYYQFSLEETVNPDNEFWGGISLKYLF